MESFLTSAGYAALILFGVLEAACIPISSEITFGFAGVLAYQGHLNLVLVIIIGSLAELAGSYLSYAVGRLGGRPLVHKLGRYVLVTESDVARAERFLEGRGAWAYPGSNTNSSDQLDSPNSAELLENGHILISDENNSRAL